MPTTIVVPLDGSENAEEALPWAVALARRRQATLLLVSIVEIPSEFGEWSVTRTRALGEDMAAWMAESETYLRKVGEGLGDVAFDVSVKLGRASAEIAAIVDELEDAVVVMSSHGRTGARRILMGSVATRIVHDTECPVIVARYAQDAKRTDEASLDRMVVPLDGSEFSEYALSQAVATLGGTLTVHLMRVVELPAFRAGSVLEPGMSHDYGLITEYLDATRDEAVAYLHEQTEILTAGGHTVTSEVRDGRVAEEILNVAKEQQANLIGMATHGRGGLSRLVFGSVAERVLSESEIPLLLVRPRNE